MFDKKEVIFGSQHSNRDELPDLGSFGVPLEGRSCIASLELAKNPNRCGFYSATTSTAVSSLAAACTAAIMASMPMVELSSR